MGEEGKGSGLYSRRCLGTIAVMGGVSHVPSPFAKSLADMVQFNTEYVCGPDEFILLDWITTSEHERARNRAVDRMMGDWLFQLDTDHQFSPDLLSRLLTVKDGFNLDVVAPLYFKKEIPFLPVAAMWDEGRGCFRVALDEETGRLPWGKEDRVWPVDVTGGGGLLVGRDVFEKVKSHYPGQAPFDRVPPWSEDYSFFMKCKDVGVQPYLVPNVQYYHLRWNPVTEGDHRLAMGGMGVDYGGQ